MIINDVHGSEGGGEKRKCEEEAESSRKRFVLQIPLVFFFKRTVQGSLFVVLFPLSSSPVAVGITLYCCGFMFFCAPQLFLPFL